MDYADAMRALKQGGAIQPQIKGWGNSFIFQVPGSEFKVSRAPLLGILPEGIDVKYQSHIDKCTVRLDGSVEVKTFSFETDLGVCEFKDLFAIQWKEIIPNDKFFEQAKAEDA